MSTSDPDPARAPRAPKRTSSAPPPTRRFAPRRHSADADAGGAPARTATGSAPASGYTYGDDVWSHEVGSRRFEPSRPAPSYPDEPGIVDVTKPRPSRTAPSIATRAYEQVVPPAVAADASVSPSAFVTDALAEMALEDGTHAPPPPRRAPGGRSVPPPGFGGR